MYLEVSHHRTAGQDRSEVVVPAQLEPFEVRELEAGGLSLVLVGFGIDPCYLCLLFPFFLVPSQSSCPLIPSDLPRHGCRLTYSLM